METYQEVGLMFSITLFDKTAGRRFTRWFQEFPAARRFFFKYKHSKNLVICAYNFDPYR